MKRTFTQKVKKVPTCAADSLDALLKLYLGYLGKHPVGATIPTDANNRRARTSAAMIGLAISMSATGLVLPRHGDEAMAVEPIASEPTIPNVPTASEASTSPAPAAEPKVVATVALSASVKPELARKESQPAQKPVVEHQVKKGETLWEISKTYEVQPEAITASNNIQSSEVLPVGQKLKIPAVNGIVHEVKPGDTVEKLSESYGVQPTHLQASALVSESGQLKTGESVTVPGNVNDLLKARQDVALKRLKEHGNRLNESLAELWSEESTNSSIQATIPTQEASTDESANSVTLPSAVLKTKEPFATPQPMATAMSTPVVIPVPTPEMAASPFVAPKATGQAESSVVIPVPTPEMAASPFVMPKSTGQAESSVVIPVPTPEMAASPFVTPKSARQSESSVVAPVPTPEMAASPFVTPKSAGQAESSVVIPVPTPEMAASPFVAPKVSTIPTLRTAPFPSPETAAKPQVPQPVVIESLGTASTANVYHVKPGDTLDAIARRNGVSRATLMQANGLNNPHLLRIDQQLAIPKAQPTGHTNQTVALLPGIDSKYSRTVSGQEPQGVTVPTLAVPTPPDQIQPVVSAERLSQSPSAPRTGVVGSSNVEGAKPNPTLVADSKPSQSDNSQQSLYVEKLKSDILRLRQEYRQERGSGQAGTSTNVVVPVVSTSVPSTLNDASTPVRINPEFASKSRSESLQANRAKRQQDLEQSSSIPIEVPPPETTALTRPQGLLATAPAPAGTYNPNTRTPIGETVSPELPSLSAPDMYRPDGSTEFNGYIWPTKGVLTSGYGWRWGRMHKGIDIAAPIGTPVVAAAPGVVVSAGWNSGGYGNLVEIQHADGSLTLYAHNNKILVRRGQQVEQGQQISEMGSTGFSTGPHCHFEVHPNGRGAVNPIAYLPPKGRG
ncbi:peptidoglycan DD-metalloendopeptidase family protein [Allocoleopsis sp.]|uniref:peptidoglycan DD-metalloendopeptidase family protein n=1 Tax=Allocoleopsis sp. TaxID=3088169 RepID=UPI002FD3E38D